MKAHEGRVSARFTETVSLERIALFCESVGSELSEVAPPTFLTVFRSGEFELFDAMGLKLANVLHGEQQYKHFSEIRAGDEVSFQTRLSSVVEKRSAAGTFSFMIFETDVGTSERKIGTSRTTVIVKERP